MYRRMGINNMNSRQKGRVGHTYTEQYLKERGWSTYTCPHATLQWEGGSSGWKDAFAAPDENGKLIGGFDIIAERLAWCVEPDDVFKKLINWVRCERRDLLSFPQPQPAPTPIMASTLWQVKKTKRNSITPLLKKEIRHCADYHKLPRSSCFVIWWPNGHGPKGKPPVIWRADEE